MGVFTAEIAVGLMWMRGRVWRAGCLRVLSWSSESLRLMVKDSRGRSEVRCRMEASEGGTEKW